MSAPQRRGWNVLNGSKADIGLRRPAAAKEGKMECVSALTKGNLAADLTLIDVWPRSSHLANSTVSEPNCYDWRTACSQKVWMRSNPLRNS
jgi:hypothetical protein